MDRVREHCVGGRGGGRLTGGEVARGVGGTLLVVQQREGVQLVGGAGRQVAQHVRPVAGALHRDVARAALRALRQRDHLHSAQASSTRVSQAALRVPPTYNIRDCDYDSSH